MQLLKASGRHGRLAATLTSILLVLPSSAAPGYRRSDQQQDRNGQTDPFAVLDPQNWVNPDNMTWDDWRTPPGTNWADPSRKGSVRNFNIALVTVDYSDKEFTVTREPHSDPFGNPQPSAANIKREDVTAFYRDFLNKPGELNMGHTLHEYWMGDSGGRYGVDLTAFGVYRLPLLSYQYGISDRMNLGACPVEGACNIEIRGDALRAWREDVGDEKADSFELVFILSAGQDESATWQEFGEMKFQTPEDVTDEFGPPKNGNGSHTNYARTRYVEWTSWASASTIWPNAGDGSSTQAESSGMGTFAHELTHLLNIGDNYNNPYGNPIRRSYTGPWSMMSRGSFNGPGGPHSRWQVPPVQGSSMGSLHTVRDKAKLGLVDDKSILHVSREALADSGLIVARVTARAINPGESELIGVRIVMDADNSPHCDIETDPFCDGNDYDNYELEVIDRMGADSFTPDSGVMISKTRTEAFGDYQWTIDANPQDIELLDFYRPDGTPVMITIGDYRQLADALFHAGTRSGSEYEYKDEANRLHFYIVDIHRDEEGVLSYTAAVRSLDQGKDPHKHGARLSLGKPKTAGDNKPTRGGLTCSFNLRNTGSYSSDAEKVEHPQDVSGFLKSDVYRLKATVKGDGWKVELPNALAAAEFGESTTVNVAVAAESSASLIAVVKLTATSESDPSVSATGLCFVNKLVN
ncbi:hypothetical protein CPC735_046080 [Coccidioides posadasii C735 delta SOWgp]|uniref:M6 family metalloprotease domain-containing protein n=1 Tax=Coccidioides posadasii (strain C735) TaxID=222929 RepID=C5PFB0_COCP7|nr:hypothetical protein CPC735_046080 [Coccidioides posadasii C735 delta SOWgp]EER23238.1 hypothetical protein CPC735_046080 [Coccidioides posadasii C735 delta SOWgp]|eukprot:XP_003065383.1 hypothetical protein CPC735_046080 [Coccidioides posadasii C735 delta SOWgp]